VDSTCVKVPDDAVGPLSGTMFAIFIGPAGMFEHKLEPPADVPPDDELLDELLEPHAASPNASTVPTAMGRNL
jgi:hypothetical protein